jgi:hypothetical protein
VLHLRGKIIESDRVMEQVKVEKEAAKQFEEAVKKDEKEEKKKEDEAKEDYRMASSGEG